MVVERVRVEKNSFFLLEEKASTTTTTEKMSLSSSLSSSLLLLFSHLQLTYEVRHVERHIVVPGEKLGAGQRAAGAPFRFSHL